VEGVGGGVEGRGGVGWLWGWGGRMREGGGG